MARQATTSPARVPEISDDVTNSDRAMRWYFAWRRRPIEMPDALVTARVADRLVEMPDALVTARAADRLARSAEWRYRQRAKFQIAKTFTEGDVFFIRQMLARKNEKTIVQKRCMDPGKLVFAERA